MNKIASGIEKLVSLGNGPLGSASSRLSTNIVESLGRLGHELAFFLHKKNGLYAFESALHVFPTGKKKGVMYLEKWNDRRLWIQHYDDTALDAFFFAEGVFGDQFAIRGSEIVRFEAETGLTEPVASNLEDWASLIIEDHNYQTGYPLAHQWQEKNGPLPRGCRLAAVRPFVLGGSFDVANLFAMEAVQTMRYHGDLARQLRDVPDGTTISLEIVD